MSSRSVKAIASAIVIAVAVLAAYWYWSPFIVIRQMQAAVQARDAEAFDRHVDYPMLRESLTEQIADKFGVRMGKTDDAAGGMAASGSILGVALVSPLVEALVRPRVLMRAMQQGYLGPKAAQAAGPLPPAVDPPDEAASARPGTGRRRWTYERIDIDQLVAQAVDPANARERPEDRLVLVFQRNGFADWKLTDISIPALNR